MVMGFVRNIRILAIGVILVLTVLVGSLTVASTNTSENSLTQDLSLDVMAIDPPGTNGLATSNQIQAYFNTGQLPPFTNNEVNAYANLIYARKLNRYNLKNYFFPETIGVNKDQVISVTNFNPKIPVKIYWDRQDIPHIIAKNLSALGFGAGWAAAKQRLFEMDVLRHYAEGTLAEFLGPACSYEQMDHNQLLNAPYTKAQLKQQITNLLKVNKKESLKLLSLAKGYVKGINYYIAEAKRNPNLMPGLYTLLGKEPKPWSLTDSVAIASLIGDILGNGGGNEFGNAVLFEKLKQEYNSTQKALEVFNALKEQNDPQAPTTVSKNFPYMDQGTNSIANNAFPDPTNATVVGSPPALTPGCGGGLSSGTGLDVSYLHRSQTNKASVLIYKSKAIKLKSYVDSILISLTRPLAESNAILVGAKLSKTGHPLAVFGPQVGYFSPEILMQEDLEAPGYQAAGVGFPGLSFIIEIGRGINYAWSATTANADDTDQRFDVLCGPHSNELNYQMNNPHYLYHGKCLSMQKDSFVENLKPTLAGSGDPYRQVINIFIAKNGILQGFTYTNGKLVALVSQRATYNHDADSALGLFMMGQPSISQNVYGWQKAASYIDFSFNWFYINSKDIGYYESGLDPIRPSDINPNFPTWGTGQYQWKGFLGFSQHPQAVNPSSSILISWNNKPAPEFSAPDDKFSWGMIYRSQLLSYSLEKELSKHGGKISLANLVSAMKNAATMDLTAFSELPLLLKVIRPQNNTEVQMISCLKNWEKWGFHRLKVNPFAQQYQYQCAIAISDQFLAVLDENLFSPLLNFAGVNFDASGTPVGFKGFSHDFVNAPGQLGSAYDGGFESYVVKLLDQIEGIKVDQKFPSAFLEKVCFSGIQNCKNVIQQTFNEVQQSLEQINATSNAYLWTNDAESLHTGKTISQLDEIVFQPIGVISLAPIEWQNRPTFQQIVSFDNN